MAIDLSEYIYSNKDKLTKDLDKGIKSNKTFDKFLYQFRINGKRFRKVFDLTLSSRHFSNSPKSSFPKTKDNSLPLVSECKSISDKCSSP